MSRRVLLVGGGHSHALALLILAAKRPPGVRLTLLSDCRYAPYSGMLPGLIAGQFSQDECMIDLQMLCKRLGVEWLEAAASAVDGVRRSVRKQTGGEESFDIASVNVGGFPQPPFAAPNAVAVKPVLPFMEWVRALPEAPRLAVVGAGAGGLETALALRRRLPAAFICLSDKELLPGNNEGMRRRLRLLLQKKNIVFYKAMVKNAANDSLIISDGRRVAVSHVVFATPVGAPRWLANGGIEVDGKGFIRVNEYLQSVSSPTVFAAGDCAAANAPKAGVVAVRQAPILAANILAALAAAPLRPWRLRRRQLSIINTADGRATAAWGVFSANGRWVWRWKKYLDKKFMKRFLA